MTLVDALWVGPSGYDLPPSTRVLENGEAVYRVPDNEARYSENWEPLEQEKDVKRPSAKDDE